MHRSSERVAVAALGLSLFALAANGLAAQEAGAGLIRPGDPPALEIVYTGDVIGYLDPCG